MTLKRQLLISFILVAIVPLLFAAGFLFWTNERLAYDLYEENLQNSTRIQANVMVEQINHSMVRSGRFALSAPLRAYLSLPMEERPADLLQYPGVQQELERFRDETVNQVSVFALVDREGALLFSTGSDMEIDHLRTALPSLAREREQSLGEIFMGEQNQSLILLTPIAEREREPLGYLLLIFDSDYFFKSIGQQLQFDFAETMLYCTTHERLIHSMRQLETLPAELAHMRNGLDDQGRISATLDGKTALLRYQRIPRTSWIVINAVPTAQIRSQVLSYAVWNLWILAVIILAVILLSRMQSTRMLQPLRRLLTGVEDFFHANDKALADLGIDARTEIGYLAQTFAGMAEDVALSQRQLRESKYLYEVLLNANYELRITIDLAGQHISASHPHLDEWLAAQDCESAWEKAACFFRAVEVKSNDAETEMLIALARGDIAHPTETEFHCLVNREHQERWYRVISVPIPGDEERPKSITLRQERPEKIVLHFENVTAQKREQLRLVESARRDPLTGLLNKKAFTQLAESYLLERPTGNSVFFVDLDCFKQVNDLLGHVVGDQVLMAAAAALSTQFRAGDLVGRYGGDEFLVFAPGLLPLEAETRARALVQRLISNHALANGQTLRVSASIGVYHSRREEPLASMIRCADEAMYHAKREGKSQYYLAQGPEEEE